MPRRYVARLDVGPPGPVTTNAALHRLHCKAGPKAPHAAKMSAFCTVFRRESRKQVPIFWAAGSAAAVRTLRDVAAPGCLGLPRPWRPFSGCRGPRPEGQPRAKARAKRCPWANSNGPIRAKNRSGKRNLAPFAAENCAAVDAFHAAALEAGATDNGAPGVREVYHPAYYGAYSTPTGTTWRRSATGPSEP